MYVCHSDNITDWSPMMIEHLVKVTTNSEYKIIPLQFRSFTTYAFRQLYTQNVTNNPHSVLHSQTYGMYQINHSRTQHSI